VQILNVVRDVIAEDETQREYQEGLGELRQRMLLSTRFAFAPWWGLAETLRLLLLLLQSLLNLSW